LSAKKRKSLPGLEGVKVLPSGTPVTRCGIHGTGTAHARRYECRTARDR
jgi:hypothetical protein